MPVTWSLSEAGDLLTVEGAGVVTDEEYFEAHRGFFAATRAPVRAKLALGDWSAVTEMQLSTESIRRSVEMTRAQNGGRLDDRRMALVATSPAVYGMCRMWQLLMDESGLRCALFKDRTEALAWLRGS